MKLIIFLIFSLTLLHAVPQKEELTKEAITSFCDSLSSTKSLLFPFKCTNEEERSKFGQKGENFASKHKVTAIDPVILIPGIGGSALEVMLNSTETPYSYCYSDLDYYRRLWLSLQLLLPGEVNCWYFDIDLFYHFENHSWTNNQGVYIRPMDWGGVQGIDYMDRILGFGIGLTSYFAELIEDLKAVGYEPNVSIRGAPFDWRLADNPNDFFGRFQTLIEETYTMNNNRQVHLVAHSYGNIHTSMFLNTMPQAWKNKYIGSFISVASPWSGSPASLRALVSGDNFGVEVASWFPILSAQALRPMIRRAGGPVFLVPEVAFWKDKTLVTTPTRNYTAKDLDQLFADMGSEVTRQIFSYTDGIMESITAPRVDLHCLYGINYPTEMSYTYNNGFDEDPIIEWSELGDGTVPIESLRECVLFRSQQTQPVEIKEFDLADHFTVLTDPELLDYILKIITEHE